MNGPLRRRPRLAAALGIAAAGALLAAIHVRIGVPWSPLHSYDTRLYYLPTLSILDSRQSDPVAWFGGPFFRTVERRDLRQDPPVPHFRAPSAAEAKPVFVALLRAWAVVLRPFRPGPVDGPLVVSSFVFVSSLAAFAALVLLGRRLGHPAAGVVAGLLACGGPWGLFTFYFSTYTAASLALYVSAYAICLCGTWRSAAAAGLLAVGVALSNQSLLALLPAVPLGILCGGPWAEARRRAFAAALFCGIFAGTFLLLEAESAAMPTADEGNLLVVGPLRTLRQYLALSGHHWAELFAAYRGSLFPELCRYDSAAGIALGTASVVVLAAWCAVDRFASRNGTTADGDATSEGRASRRRAFGPVVLAALPGLVGLVVIDLKSGPKFARSYFLCLPFLLLSGTIAMQALLRGVGRRKAILAAIGGCLLVAGETGFRLGELDAALNGTMRTVHRMQAAGEKVVVAPWDNYAPFLRRAGCPPLPELSADMFGASVGFYVLVGPAGPSALDGAWTSGKASIPGRLELAAHHPELVAHLPFFSHLPYLTYEDPLTTHAVRVRHVIEVDDFLRPAGMASLWRLPQRDRVQPVDPPSTGARRAD